MKRALLLLMMIFLLAVCTAAWAENEQLPKPNAWLEDCRITEGESVVIHVDKTENAAQFSSYVFHIGDQSEIMLDTIKKPGEITFTPEYSGIYFVSVTSQAPGYEENTIWLPFLVTSGDFQDFSNETVNLFVDKTTVDTFEDTVRVLAFYPETEHFILYDNGEVLAEEFGFGIDLSFGYGKAGDHVLTVGYEDASGKMIYPKNCSVTIHAVAENGSLPKPNAWLEDCRVTEGDSIVIHVGETENAAQFSSYIFNIGDETEIMLDTIKKPGDITFKPEHSGVYCVSVTSQASGYEEDTIWLPFLVTSGNFQDFSNETVNLFVDKTTVGTFEDTVHVLAFYPEAEYFILYDNGETLAEGEYTFGIDQNFGWGKAGDHVLTVSYEDASGKMIFPENCSATIRVVAENGPLPEPNAFIGESVVSFGETAVIHIADTENAAQFSSWAYNHFNQEEYPVITIKGAGDIPFTPDLSGYYSLVIVAQAPGYEESVKVLPLMVVDEKDECFRTDDFVFTFSAPQFDPDTEIHMTAFYPGADAVHLYDIDNQLPGDVNWEEMAGEGVLSSDPGLDTWVSWAHPGTHNICISACIGDVWTQPVQVCTLLVNSTNDILSSADLVLPSALTSIEEEAFIGITAHTVRLGDAVKSIGSGAFADCAGLEEIYIPAAVTSIGSGAFAGCGEHLCIRGYAGSFAETYARNNGIQFLPID